MGTGSAEAPKSEKLAPIQSETPQAENLTLDDIEKMLETIPNPIMREKTQEYLMKQKKWNI